MKGWQGRRKKGKGSDAKSRKVEREKAKKEKGKRDAAARNQTWVSLEFFASRKRDKGNGGVFSLDHSGFALLPFLSHFPSLLFLSTSPLAFLPYTRYPPLSHQLSLSHCLSPPLSLPFSHSRSHSRSHSLSPSFIFELSH
jgi:hypothetical protein